MTNSGFIEDDATFDAKDRSTSQGATSDGYVVNIDGKNLFKKRLRPEFVGNQRYLTLFEKEFAVGNSLQSPYIPQYVSINKDGEGVYILMEYVLGENIEEKLKSDPLYFHNDRNMRKLLLQLFEGLAELHRKEAVYLDINPKNIMLTKFGNNVKITDLGFCANSAYWQTAGSTVGFASPEVIEKNLNEIDERSDIYSVGLLLRYIKERSGAEFSRRVKRVMERCLNVEKKLRFATAHEAIKALDRRNGWKEVTGLVMLCAVLVAIVSHRLSGDVRTAVLNGVEYCVLSRENNTCMVVGGPGVENNIYIEPEMTIAGKLYRTVAIADSAFDDSGIYSVSIPEGVEVVGRGAFCGCDSVITISLPSTIKDFTGAFVRMSNVTRISLPAVKEVCPTAFVDNYSVEDVYIPEGVERIGRDAFVSCIKLKRVNLPQTLNVIERGVFYNCKALKEIVIPEHVNEIGDYAFYNCDSLGRVYCHAMTPPRITAIFNKSSVVVYVPAKALEAYKASFSWGEYNIQPMPEQNEN